MPRLSSIIAKEDEKNHIVDNMQIKRDKKIPIVCFMLDKHHFIDLPSR
jgi:hypothetical protein